MNSSGADDPAAMKVAPATSSERSKTSEMASRDGTKKSSQIIATATNSQSVPNIQRNISAPLFPDQSKNYD